MLFGLCYWLGVCCWIGLSLLVCVFFVVGYGLFIGCICVLFGCYMCLLAYDVFLFRLCLWVCLLLLLVVICCSWVL